MNKNKWKRVFKKISTFIFILNQYYLNINKFVIFKLKQNNIILKDKKKNFNTNNNCNNNNNSQIKKQEKHLEEYILGCHLWEKILAIINKPM